MYEYFKKWNKIATHPSEVANVLRFRYFLRKYYGVQIFGFIDRSMMLAILIINRL
jgi:hypothetical protein